jgi:hypothetical protein
MSKYKVGDHVIYTYDKSRVKGIVLNIVRRYNDVDEELTIDWIGSNKSTEPLDRVEIDEDWKFRVKLKRILNE